MTVLSHLSSSELYAPSPTSTIPPMLLGDASSWGQLRGRAWVTRGLRGQRKRGTLSAVKAQALPQRDRWQPGERTPPADSSSVVTGLQAGLTGPGRRSLVVHRRCVPCRWRVEEGVSRPAARQRTDADAAPWRDALGRALPMHEVVVRAAPSPEAGREARWKPGNGFGGASGQNVERRLVVAPAVQTAKPVWPSKTTRSAETGRPGAALRGICRCPASRHVAEFRRGGASDMPRHSSRRVVYMPSSSWVQWSVHAIAQSVPAVQHQWRV